MKKAQISVNGKISSNGRLNMYMGELNAFVAQHPGATVVARFHVYKPQSSEAFRGYYYHHIVPSFQQAIWENGERLTEASTEMRLREISPIMHEETVNEETGEYGTRIRTVVELSNQELVEHVETLKQIAAEEYSFYIEDFSQL